ncbi:MAG: hypothetical protein IT337_12095 [Thermomicrobiales bacterium]|nr:hypothetical protein [Thermomicrobiales bacterium]
MTTRADAPPRALVALNHDLMFGIHIGKVARALGFAPSFARTTEAFCAAIRAADPPAALGVIDMNADINWPLVAALAAEDGPTPLLGFGPHLDVDGRRAAKAAGLTRIVANSEFHRDMEGLIRRYARPSPVSDTEE